MNTVVLQTKDSQGKELWISRDQEGSSVLFCLDCNFHSLGGRDFDELPRYYRTVRGARMAAAKVTGEKLDWTVTDAAALNMAGKSPVALPTLAELSKCPHCGSDTYYVRYTYSGQGAYHRHYDGSEGADNSGIYDKLGMKPGKRAFCSDCHKPVAQYHGEFE